MYFSVRQTPCLVRKGNALENELLVTVEHCSEHVTLTMDDAVLWQGTPAGDEFAVYIPEVTALCEGHFALSTGETFSLMLRPQRRWEVHLVQFSHHDPGYTDLPSHVLWESAKQLHDALDNLDAREDWPEEAKPRIVIEQAYSLYQFLRRADPADQARMIRHIRAGNIEVTAFWANLISELLSPEESLRAMYPSKAIEDMTGVPIVSAEHNDITGFTWGYATALCRAGVKYFMPNLPLYYSWGYQGYESFWEEEKVFGRKGPGAIWWESPEGERIFLWCNNNGCVEELNPQIPSLRQQLEDLEAADWPHRVFRLQVKSESRDNSNYIADYADMVRAWNEKYEWPKLICSTEKMFSEAFLQNLTVELPVLKGGVDGQDYPIASTSQMVPSSLVRQTHAIFRSAEILNAITPEKADFRPERLSRAMEDILMADEHAYGHNAPDSHQQLSSWWEHGVYAPRAYSDSLRVFSDSASLIAEAVQGSEDRHRITVFNTSGLSEAVSVEASLRPFLCRHTEGNFRLVELSTGKDIPFRLRKLDWDDAVLMAGEKTGIGAGTRRMGLFDPTTQNGYELHFTAPCVPAYGYAAFELVEDETAAPEVMVPAYDHIENEFYRISFDPSGILDVTDLADGRSLLDAAAPHKLGDLLIRYANDEAVPAKVTSVKAEKSAVESLLTITLQGDGLFSAKLEVKLAGGVDNISLTARVIKNPKPLQTLYLAFPFAGSGVRYQSVLHETAPACSLLPGSHSDVIAVQDWVQTQGSDILWNSANSPVVSLSHLWPGYISPAHRCIMVPPGHPPLKPEQFDTGRIYSILTCNNFGTNFYTAQVSDAVYRYTFAAAHGRDRYAWGAKAAETLTHVVTSGVSGNLPAAETVLSVPGLRILTLKKAENKNGLILRVQNDTGRDVTASAVICGKASEVLALCDALERDTEALEGREFTVPAGKLATVRLKAELL